MFCRRPSPPNGGAGTPVGAYLGGAGGDALISLGTTARRGEKKEPKGGRGRRFSKELATEHSLFNSHWGSCRVASFFVSCQLRRNDIDREG
jgi:hypothetical protein